MENEQKISPQDITASAFISIWTEQTLIDFYKRDLQWRQNKLTRAQSERARAIVRLVLKYQSFQQSKNESTQSQGSLLNIRVLQLSKLYLDFYICLFEFELKTALERQSLDALNQNVISICLQFNASAL